MKDLWEINYQLDPLNPDDATWDNDSDTLSALEEFGNKTSPLSADTDQDGHNDAKEINKGTDPNDPDSKPGNAFLDCFHVAVDAGSHFRSIRFHTQGETAPARPGIHRKQNNCTGQGIY